jgi:hypothetical protein
MKDVLGNWSTLRRLLSKMAVTDFDAQSAIGGAVHVPLEPNSRWRAGESPGRSSPFGLTEGLGGARSMRRTERSQGDVQLAIANADIARGGEQLMQQGSSLLIDPSIVRPQQRKQIALGLTV